MKIIETNGIYLRVKHKSTCFRIPTSLDLDSDYAQRYKQLKGSVYLWDSWFIVKVKVTNQRFYKLGKQLAKM